MCEVCPHCRGPLTSEVEASAPVSSPSFLFSANRPSLPCGCHQHRECVHLRKSHHPSPADSSSGPTSPSAVKLFLWVFLLFPLSSMANPIPPSGGGEGSGSSRRRPHDRPSSWINPCRIPSALPSFPHMELDIEIVAQSDSELISNIITQVNKAELQAKKYIEKYYKETFGEELRERDRFPDVHYDFLKEINDKVKKRYGESLSREDLEELKIAETLRSMYRGLQSFAVGLEQVVLDQSVYGGNFHKDFQETEYQLKYLLCEIQLALLEKGIQHEDVTREIMSGDYRDVDCDTVRNIRDWVIFRDYVNTLEYIQQSFTYFLDNVDNS